jgi:N-methylhydantoinase B
MSHDPVRLEVFKHLFASIADEMGVVLRKSSHSPNIKERRDYSCAIFDATGNMISQAAHIPVHLGSMPLSVMAAIGDSSHQFQKTPVGCPGLNPGDMIILNDPYRGGTHLPDITWSHRYLINKLSPALIGFVASRAHMQMSGYHTRSMPIRRYFKRPDHPSRQANFGGGYKPGDLGLDHGQRPNSAGKRG